MREFNIVATHKIAIQKSIFINKLENIMVKKKSPSFNSIKNYSLPI